MCKITIVPGFIPFTVACKRPFKKVNPNKYIVYLGLRALKRKEQFHWKDKFEWLINERKMTPTANSKSVSSHLFVNNYHWYYFNYHNCCHFLSIHHIPSSVLVPSYLVHQILKRTLLFRPPHPLFQMKKEGPRMVIKLFMIRVSQCLGRMQVGLTEILQKGKNSKDYHQGSNRELLTEEHYSLPCCKWSIILGERKEKKRKIYVQEWEGKEDNILELVILSG